MAVQWLATAVVLATMVAGLFELNLGDSEVLTMFLVVAGCGYVATEAVDTEAVDKEPTEPKEPAVA